jgi:hypothetical protein
MVRVHLNDTQSGATGTPGEGRIFIDTASFIIPLLNECLVEFARDLENGGVKTSHEEMFSTSAYPVTPVYGSAGVGIPDPSVFQELGFVGFFDGNTTNTNLKLPSDFLVPLKVEQRTHGSGLPYTLVNQAQSSLISAYQDSTLGQWEFRQDGIWWNGATISKDVRIRYIAGIPLFSFVPPSSFPITFLPILDCQDAMSYLMAYKFSAPRALQGTADDLYTKYKMATNNLIARQVRTTQAINYRRTPYGDAGEIVDW